MAPRPYHLVLRAIPARRACAGYQPFHPDYAFLFNSYYVSAGPRHARHQRGHLTRPSADEVTAYRRHVDAAVVKFFQTAGEDTLAGMAPLVEVGLNHEQQHQELMLTDILHAFAQNRLAPPITIPAICFPAQPVPLLTSSHQFDLHRPQLAAGLHEVSPLAEGQDG